MSFFLHPIFHLNVFPPISTLKDSLQMTVPISVIGLMPAAAGCIGNPDSVNDELIEFNES